MWSPPYAIPEPPPDGKWETKVTFSEPGNYVLRAVASDGSLFTYQDVNVTVTRWIIDQPAPRTIYIAHRNGRAIHRDGWKLIAFADGREELYHLTDDPFEKTDLAGTESARREQLKWILAEPRKGDGDVIPTDLRAFEEIKGAG